VPLYYTEGNEQLFARVNAICNTIEAERKIAISINARVLIFNAISAVREDPSLAWVANNESVEAQFARLVEELPLQVDQMVTASEVGGRVTYFDAMHWLSGHLDAICPFQKTSTRRGRRGR
jgi:hypothetical protein